MPDPSDLSRAAGSGDAHSRRVGRTGRNACSSVEMVRQTGTGGESGEPGERRAGSASAGLGWATAGRGSAASPAGSASAGRGWRGASPARRVGWPVPSPCAGLGQAAVSQRGTRDERGTIVFVRPRPCRVVERGGRAPVTASAPAGSSHRLRDRRLARQDRRGVHLRERAPLRAGRGRVGGGPGQRGEGRRGRLRPALRQRALRHRGRGGAART